MSYRVGVNGFGRIGRGFVRCLVEPGLLGESVDIVAVNDLWRYHSGAPAPVDLGQDRDQAAPNCPL